MNPDEDQNQNQGGDDLYPADGRYYQPTKPAELTAAEKAEQAKVLEAIPMLQEIISRFDEQIAVLKSTDAIPASVLKKTEEFMHVVAGNKIAAAFLESEKGYLEGLVKTYKR